MSETELFDIYDADGRHLGMAQRADVHRIGYWHHTFHCWVARRQPDGRTSVLFQRRAPGKDTNPGSFDITAAGHLLAGETIADAAREMEEELGWSVPFEQLVPFGTIREEAEGTNRGQPYADREVSHVFGCLTTLPLAEFRLQEEEVSGLYEADAGEMIELMNGERAFIEAYGVSMKPLERSEVSAVKGALVAHTVVVKADDFVHRQRSYYVDVFRFLSSLSASGADNPD